MKNQIVLSIVALLMAFNSISFAGSNSGNLPECCVKQEACCVKNAPCCKDHKVSKAKADCCEAQEECCVSNNSCCETKKAGADYKHLHGLVSQKAEESNSSCEKHSMSCCK